MKTLFAVAALAFCTMAVPAEAARDKSCPVILCIEGYHLRSQDHPNLPCWVDTCVPDDPSKGHNPNYREVCGPTICTSGTLCCNASCGICTPTGDNCIQIVCDSGAEATHKTGAELLMGLLLPEPKRENCSSPH